MLPSDKTKNIQSSDLTRILDFLVEVKILERASPDNTTERRFPGHPKRNDTNVRMSGPKSLYKASPFYYNLKDVLRKPKALMWIHTLLLESGYSTDID